MPRFPVVLRGYDCDQVDALIARIEAVLRDGAPRPTAEDVLSSRFAVVLRGYDQGAVDRFLYARIRELSARALPQSSPRRRADVGRLIDWIESVEFPATRVHARYDVREVDAFLERVVAGLHGAAPPLTSGDVKAGAFRRVRVGRGYDRGEVDRFLGRLAEALDDSVVR
ncbi:DivIVA domain-containing protein [Thermomonospora umbrina]|uniref:Cell wall synthesis protein Wag31 n=1 Tax=Thermomonospora umbrina TaxID=111806 RepID=A0A3D9SX83_9ACTN|nr:DivIVA domain-containing protein [Thermomonospora umbrina]REE99120.1 DivIVA domain-containing protein [Thermomonospora umbrina]